jgi:hypothetical protein
MVEVDVPQRCILDPTKSAIWRAQINCRVQTIDRANATTMELGEVSCSVRSDGGSCATICGEAAGLYYGLTTCGQSIAHTLEQ